MRLKVVSGWKPTTRFMVERRIHGIRAERRVVPVVVRALWWQRVLRPLVWVPMWVGPFDSCSFLRYCGSQADRWFVAQHGTFPSAPEGNGAFLCTGPLVRRVEDIWPLLQVMAGPDDQDPACRPMVLGDPKRVDLSDLVIYPLETNGRQGVRREMRQAVRDSAAALAERGATVKHIDLPSMKKAMDIWAAMLSDAASQHYPEILGADGRPIRPMWELLKACVGRSNFTAIAVFIAGLDGLTGRFDGHIRKLVQAGKTATERVGCGVGRSRNTATPTVWSSGTIALGRCAYAIFTGSYRHFQCDGKPGYVFAGCLSRKNLPISVQVVAAPGQDHLTVAVATALEADFGGWKRAPVT